MNSSDKNWSRELSNKSVSFSIETEVPPTFMRRLLDFICQKYLLPQKQRFANIERKLVKDNSAIGFTILDSSGKEILNVEIAGGKPIRVNIEPLNEMVSEGQVEEVKQDIIIVVELFEEKVRESTLYFAWREGEAMLVEKLHGKEKHSINKLFLETQILLFVVFITLGMFLFLIVGWLAPVVLLAIQLVFVFYSNKFIARTADWQITSSNPIIHLLEYHLPFKEHEEFRQMFPRDKLLTIKKEIYEETLAKKGEIDCETAQKVFSKHGLACRSEELTSKKVNVYQLVQKVAEKFGFPMPEVVVSNTMIPNAAASGPSPSHGVVLITTGLLVQLEDKEIISVLGHEFGHLKGRDPLLLYGLTGAEFLFRFYVLFPLFPFIFYSYLFFVYFWLVMTFIYFIAKFFEARADILSAVVMGQPEVLAGALEKIGFKRLLYERAPAYRFQEWVSLDPHPPIYFRVNRLEKIKTPVEMKHPLIQSAKDVINGFFATL